MLSVHKKRRTIFGLFKTVISVPLCLGSHMLCASLWHALFVWSAPGKFTGYMLILSGSRYRSKMQVALYVLLLVLRDRVTYGRACMLSWFSYHLFRSYLCHFPFFSCLFWRVDYYCIGISWGLLSWILACMTRLLIFWYFSPKCLIMYKFL